MPFDLRQALSEQKAIPNHPALMDRTTPVSIYSTGNSGRKDSLISQHDAMRHSTAYGGDQAIDWVYDCINLYADAASSADYRLEKLDGTNLVRTKTPGTPPEYEVGPADLYDLLDKPNPFMYYDELLALLITDLLLVGNAYWFLWQMNDKNRPLALYRLAPGYVKIKPSQYGPAGYEYQPPGARKPLKIDPSMMIHFRRPNPHSAYLGMGVIQGGGRSFDMELAITDTITSYYENRASPSVIFQSDRRVPRDIFKKLHAQMRARTAGPNKAGEMLVLEQGLKASSLSLSAADSLFYQLATMSRDRVYAKFRANPMLFGLMDETSGTNKVSDMRREFDNSALRPLLKRLSVKISEELAAAWGVKFIIDHRSYLPSEEAIKVAESIAVMPGVKVREIRRQYEQFGIEESTGDPKIDNLVLNKPTPEIGPDGMIHDPLTGKRTAPVGADQAIGKEPGAPAKGTNTKIFGIAPAGKKSLEDVLRELEAKAVSTPAPNNALPGEIAPADRFAAARATDIQSTATTMSVALAEAATQLERELLDVVEGKALKTSDIVSRVRNAAAWKNFRAQVAGILKDGVVRSASSGVMHSGLTPDESVDYDALADDVVGRKDGLSSVIRTLKERAVNRVKAARDADGERHDFNGAIREVINEWQTGQARTIANTEAVHGYNEATLQAAELSGVSQVYVTDGEDHDDACVEANGSVWDISTARERRLEHPNCYRAFLPLQEVG